MDKVFDVEYFTSSSWGTKKKKAKFADQFAQFCTGGWQRKDFPLWFFNAMKYTFGKMTYFNVEHYNKDLFYDIYFLSAGDTADFIQNILGYNNYYLYSDCGANDLISAINSWLVDNKIHEQLIKMDTENKYSQLKYAAIQDIERLEAIAKEFSRLKDNLRESAEQLHDNDKEMLLERLRKLELNA